MTSRLENEYPKDYMNVMSRDHPFNDLHTGEGWILATCPCVLAWVNTWDSLLIKDIKRLWPIRTVHISNMQYAFGVQVYGEVLYLEFYSAFSQQFINDEILLF